MELSLLSNVSPQKAKRSTLSVIYCLILSFPFLLTSCQQSPTIQDLVPYVNPLIGTESVPAFSNGNTYPAVARPFGMTAWTPQTGEERWIYTYESKEIQGFRATHQPSPWMGDYGQFSIMPALGRLLLDDRERASEFDHGSEESGPDYYSVILARDSIRGEMTATTRCGFMRFTMPEHYGAYIIVDAGKQDGEMRLDVKNQRIYGISRTNSSGVPENFGSYFVIEFNKPFNDYGVSSGPRPFPMRTELKSQDVCAYVNFPTKQNDQITLKIGTSFISHEQALLNLQQEIGERTFDEVRRESAGIWNSELNKIAIESASEDQKTTFYTAFYRALLFPRIFHEMTADGKQRHYSPYNGEVLDGPLYTDNGFWDTFRAVFPFFSILYPDRSNEIIEGLLNAYREGGWMPKWMSPGYRNVMIGTHTASVIADAYAKGIRDYDVEQAYEAIRKDAMTVSHKPGTGREGVAWYDSLGYVPSDIISEATARTLEFAYGDFCVAQMAAALGKAEDAEYFKQRSMNYANVFDAKNGFMRGRFANGDWRPDFSPIEWGGPFTEGSAWHYTWSVMHDPQGLINLYGGRDNFVAKLDAVFDTPPDFDMGSYGYEIHEMTEMVAANMGQYAHGNQPVHHLIYLYLYAGEPWKTQQRAREIMTKLYGPGPDGLAGDEDNGQMSAWYLLSALGFYSVSPGYPQYMLGAPLFDRAVVYLPSGKTLTINAENQQLNHPYVASLSVNGANHDANWIDHRTLVNGATLDFVMSATPNRERGTSAASFPPSLTEGDGVSIPILKSDAAYFLERIQLEMECLTPGAEIRYTMDGSIPTKNSPLYSGSLNIDATMKIQARAFKDGLLPSAVVYRQLELAVIQKPAAVSGLRRGFSYGQYRGTWSVVPPFDTLEPVKTGRAKTLDATMLKGEDDFGIAVNGYVRIPQDGIYRFYTTSDDGSVLRIGDRVVVNNDGLHGPRESYGDIALAKGYHPLTAGYFELGGGELFEMHISGPGLEKRPLQTLLYTD